MTAGGLLMIAIFGHIRFVLYKRLARAAAAGDVPAGMQVLATLRTWVGVNLALGVAVIVATLLL
jgi:uncharacterized membrane protein